MTDDEVLRLQVHGVRMARSVGATARTAAEDLGFDAATDAERVGAMAEHLCDLLARTDFDDPDDARFEVSIHERPAALALRVADQGLPMSLRGATGRAVAAELAGAPHVDAVRIDSDGDGNAVIVEVRRDPGRLDHLVDDRTPTAEASELAEPRVEVLERRHLESLARCTWRVYGPTYVASFLYHPKETWKMVESGRLHSAVALDADDEVVGHAAVELERAGSRVGDFTLALTDPRYRGHGILGLTRRAVGEQMEALGLVGTLAEAVTTHTITQRERVEHGAVETGVLIGFIPSSMTYRGFSSDIQGASRQSAVLSYLALGPGTARTVHLPERYRDVMADCYDRLGLDRRFADGAAPEGETEMDVVVDRPRALATLEVRVVGADAAHVVDHHRRDLCAAGTEIVHVELPLDDPGTPAAVADLRDRGFAYAGFVPELRGTDVLRLQYLDVEVDTGIIQLLTDEARQLLDIAEADLRDG